MLAIAFALPADRSQLAWIVIASAIIFVVVAVCIEVAKWKRDAVRGKILKGFEVFYSQGTKLMREAAASTAIDEWEGRLARFLQCTLGNRHHQRLLTAGVQPTNSRVMLYLNALDTFTGELNSSAFDRDIRYPSEADELLRQSPIS